MCLWAALRTANSHACICGVFACVAVVFPRSLSGGFACGFDTSTCSINKTDNGGIIWQCWKVWQLIQRGHWRVTKVTTLGEINRGWSCGVARFVPNSPFLCLTQTGCNSCQASAADFCWSCRESCHCGGDGKTNVWVTCHADTEQFTE